MSEEFKVEIVNPEKSFLSKEDVIEVVVPAFEGEMGIKILKNSNDGFKISEEDIKLRAFGDLLGFKQSGIKRPGHQKFLLSDDN